MKILEMLGFGTIGVTATGAVANVVCELSNNFVELGHDVTLADVRSPRPRKLLDPRVRVCEVDVPSPLDTEITHTLLSRLAGRAISYTPLKYHHYRSLRRLLAHFRYVRAVASTLRLGDYDVIHTHEAQQAIFLLKLYRRPYVYTNHWQYPPGAHNLHVRIEKAVIRGARTAIGLGRFLQRFEPSGHHVVVSNGIDPEKWKRLPQRECRDILGIPERDFVVVFVGGVEHRKGVDVLLKAFHMLTPENRDARLYVIGHLGSHKYTTVADRHAGDIDGYARALMEESKGSPVFFLGFMDNMSPEFRQYLSAADVFVVPSRSDAHPLVVYEALAMGLPVVVSDTGGLPEMVTSDVGYTFRSGDSEELGRILRHLASNPAHLEALRHNCRSYIEKHHSWRSIALRYIDVFTN